LPQVSTEAWETGSTISFSIFHQDPVAATIEQAAGWMYLPKGEILASNAPGSHSIGVRGPLGVVASFNPGTARTSSPGGRALPRGEQTGPDRYVAHGTLDLRGVRKLVDPSFRLKINGGQAEMAGQANVDRTAFGVGQGTFAATDQIPARVALATRISAHAAH
jgi:hypothetical protein